MIIFSRLILNNELEATPPVHNMDLELAPGKIIGEGKPRFIIAEIGLNHNGKSISI